VAKWATVTVIGPEGKRHSIDVLAESSYDAAHLYLSEAKKNRKSALPVPDVNSMFEVVSAGRVYHVSGVRLREWIRKRRGQLNGPAGYLFSKRATLD
jgi:hypothetical protein